MEFFNYLVWQNIKEFKRTPKVFAAIIITLTLGMAAFASCMTLLSAINKAPLPEVGDRTFHVSLNNWPDEREHGGETPMPYVLYRNAEAIMQHTTVEQSALLFSTYLYVTKDSQAQGSYYGATSVNSTTGFFDLMQYAFAHGDHWQTDDAHRSVVLSHRFNQQLFADENSVGQTLMANGEIFTVVGVLEESPAVANFYRADLYNNVSFAPPPDIYFPLETAIDLNFKINGNMSSSEGIRNLAEARTKAAFFLHLWVRLKETSDKAALQQHLDQYMSEQKALGLHPQPIDNPLHTVAQWSRKTKLVDQRLIALSIASILLLIASLFNASSLLVNRLEGFRSEYALRRALGVSQFQLVMSGLVMTGLLAIVVAILASTLCYLFLHELGQQFTAYQAIIGFSGELVIITSVLSLCCVLFCISYPLLKNILQPIHSQLTR